MKPFYNPAVSYWKCWWKCFNHPWSSRKTKSKQILGWKVPHFRVKFQGVKVPLTRLKGLASACRLTTTHIQPDTACLSEHPRGTQAFTSWRIVFAHQIQPQNKTGKCCLEEAWRPETTEASEQNSPHCPLCSSDANQANSCVEFAVFVPTYNTVFILLTSGQNRASLFDRRT